MLVFQETVCVKALSEPGWTPGGRKGGANVPVVSVYSTDPEIRCSLKRQLEELEQEDSGQVRAECFSNFSEFLESGRQNCRRILMLAEKGTAGVELAAAAAEECPESPVVWLSDLDFALFSYRLEVDYFGFLPPSAETLGNALRNCRQRCALGTLTGPLPDPPNRSLWARAWEYLRRYF